MPRSIMQTNPTPSPPEQPAPVQPERELEPGQQPEPELPDTPDTPEIIPEPQLPEAVPDVPYIEVPPLM
jgi:hypothetical protein